jgi:CRP-like cAMP-binding protein
MTKACWYLQDIDLFAGISQEDLLQICEGGTRRKIEEDEDLYEPGTFLDRLFVIDDGAVTLYSKTDSGRTVLEELQSGDVFGNITTKPSMSNHYAEAKAGSVIYTFAIQDLLNLFSKRPEILLRTLRLVADRIEQYQERLTICNGSAKEKILHAIKTYTSKRRLTHARLGVLTGLNRVTVTRALGEMIEAGEVMQDELTKQYTVK